MTHTPTTKDGSPLRRIVRVDPNRTSLTLSLPPSPTYTRADFAKDGPRENELIGTPKYTHGATLRFASHDSDVGADVLEDEQHDLAPGESLTLEDLDATRAVYSTLALDQTGVGRGVHVQKVTS